MMANNWQRLNIWLSLKNRFDYAEYTAACNAAGCSPHNALEFAQKAGMVTTGLATYPELPVAEAYLTFVRDNQEAFTPPAQQVTQAQSTQIDPQTGLPPGYKKEKVTITYADGKSEEREVAVAVQKQGCCGGGGVR